MIFRFLYYLGVYVRLWIFFWYVRKEWVYILKIVIVLIIVSIFSIYNGKEVINFEYIWNYNYVYIGELVFSKKFLFMDDGGVGVRWSEGFKDKNIIKKGYNVVIVCIWISMNEFL